MAYKIRKSIPQYSLVDIFEILLNKNHPEFAEVKREFEKRRPTEKEIEIAKKGLEIRLKARNKPLTFWDKLYCLILPILYSNKSLDFNSSKLEDAFQEHLSEFEMYGESKRAEELKKWQSYSRIFHFSLFGIIIVISLLIYFTLLIKNAL